MWWFRFFQLFVPVIEIDKVPKLRWKLTLSLIYFSFFLLSMLVWWEGPWGIMFTPICPAAQWSSVVFYILLGGSPITPCLFLLHYCRMAGIAGVRQSPVRWKPSLCKAAVLEYGLAGLCLIPCSSLYPHYWGKSARNFMDDPNDTNNLYTGYNLLYV